MKKIVEHFPRQSPDGRSPNSVDSSSPDSQLDQSPESQSNGHSPDFDSSGGINPSGKSSQSSSKVSEPPSLSRQVMKWVFWGGAFLTTATISAALGATVALLTPLSPLIKSESPDNLKEELWKQGFRYSLARPVNILLMGVDWMPNAPANSPEVFAGRTDTMLLVGLDPQIKTANVLSIPRDTQVEIPGFGINKINQANVEGGAALTARVVSGALNNVTVDRYVRVTNNAVRELVDLMGGIEIYVPYAMQYQDVTQNLFIDLKPGWQTLNGAQVEQFARFRSDGNGDIGRVQRQQTLLKAIRQRLLNPSVLPRLPQILGVMQQYVDTNLSLEEIMALGSFMLDVQPETLRMVLLPGRFSQPQEFQASYWLIDFLARDRIMEQYFQLTPPNNTTNNPYELTTTQRPQVLRIAIQNATGRPRAAEEFADYLAKKGFNNTYVINNWTEELPQTQIIAQKGDLQTATKLQQSWDLGAIEASSTGDIDSDFTIRLGLDWLERQPESSPKTSP